MEENKDKSIANTCNLVKCFGNCPQYMQEEEGLRHFIHSSLDRQTDTHAYGSKGARQTPFCGNQSNCFFYTSASTK